MMPDFKTTPNTNLKDEAHEIIETLSNFNPTIHGIQQSISRSNSYIENLQKTIKNINLKDELIRDLALLKIKTSENNIKENLKQFVYELNTAKTYGETISENYENCVIRLAQIAEAYEDNDFQNNLIQIIAVNKLKLENIKSQLRNTEAQISTLENFQIFKLYHLKDAVITNEINPKANNIDDATLIERVGIRIKKLKSFLRTSKRISIGLIALSIVNLCAVFYKFEFTKTIKNTIEITKPKNSNNIEPHTDILVLFSGIFDSMFVILSLLTLPLLISGIITRRIGHICAAAFIMVSIIILNGLTESLTNVKEESYELIERTYSLDFYNLGTTGSIIMITLSILTMVAFYLKNRTLKSTETLFIDYLELRNNKG